MSVLKNKDGLSAIIVILAILIIVMGVLIIVPKVLSGKDEAGKEADIRHEQTATDSAIMQYAASGPFNAIYDYKNKKFVTGMGGKKVEPYGESDEHIGMVIYVIVNKDGKTKIKWEVPQEVPVMSF